jgi:hypothetical protein
MLTLDKSEVEFAAEPAEVHSLACELSAKPSKLF